MEFEKVKRDIVNKIQAEILQRKVDEDIVPLIELINSEPCYVTLSSCSGRILVLDQPSFGSKLESRFVGKWHRTVSVNEVCESLEKCNMEGWFFVQPPILHIMCKTLKDAENLLKLAAAVGFRESGIISLRKNVVRISSSERIETLLSRNRTLLVSRPYLKSIVDVGNKKLLKTKVRIEKLIKRISRTS